MPDRLDEFGQPVGDLVPHWTPRALPPPTPMHGRFCRVVRLDVERHAAALHAAYAEAPDGRGWTYLFTDPFPTLAEYRDALHTATAGTDPLPHAILDAATGEPLGAASFMRIDRAHGTIEIGAIHFSPRLQRRPAATEAIALMMRRAFDELGYRRLEWKCDSLNAPSRAAALRLGFSFEGIFRQAVVYKGRNRDTAWFSVTDADWPTVREGFDAWLDPANFDPSGLQRQSLQAVRVLLATGDAPPPQR